MIRRTIAAAVSVGVALAGTALAAPAHAVTDPTAAVTAANDWNDDGLSDVAVLTTDGKVYVQLNGGGRFARTPVLVATGLRGYDWVQMAGDVDEDGYSDILTRSGYGRLLLLRGGAVASLAGVVPVAGAWSSYEEIVPIDVDRDGDTDLLGVDRAQTGTTIRTYAGETGVRFRALGFTPLSPRFDQLTAYGDGDGDGYQEIVARETATGRLFALETRGTFTLFQHASQHRLIGSGWGAFTTIHSTGDFGGDGLPDLLARTADGTVLRYETNGAGRLLRPWAVGSRWGNLVFG